ncbi:MAG: Holliday junction branch migration protein RuvA [Pseudomonadota bacterium]
MIGRLTGTVVDVADVAILDVQGVGYEVHLPSRDLAALSPGDSATLVIETVVREDMIRLYGFRDRAAKDWFRLLQSVQGVGAKVALGVLSVLSAEDLAAAIAVGDKAAIERAPGVGKRVAERIATELKSKAPASAVSLVLPTAAAGRAPADEPVADAISALVNLGYDEMQARSALQAVRSEKPEAAAAELIRAGLKRLAA